jgi:hypothetical protein
LNNRNGLPRKVIPIVPAEGASAPTDVGDDGGVMVSLYEAHQKIYPRSVAGFFSNWRWAMVWVTQLVFYGLAWLEWGQRQAVLFDLGARRFYIFGLVLYPQDFIYLTGILVISALSLFLFTAVAGRLWCGYACPQTVYTEMFLWLEKLAEGDRSARMRRDAGGWTADKLWRKFLKHALWLIVALWTGFTFVGYFTPIRDLGPRAPRWGGWALSGCCFTVRNLWQRRFHAGTGLQTYVPMRGFKVPCLTETHSSSPMTRRVSRVAHSRKADPAQLNLFLCGLQLVCRCIHGHRYPKGPATSALVVGLRRCL